MSYISETLVKIPAPGNGAPLLSNQSTKTCPVTIKSLVVMGSVIVFAVMLFAIMLPLTVNVCIVSSYVKLATPSNPPELLN